MKLISGDCDHNRQKNDNKINPNSEKQLVIDRRKDDEITDQLKSKDQREKRIPKPIRDLYRQTVQWRDEVKDGSVDDTTRKLRRIMLWLSRTNSYFKYNFHHWQIELSCRLNVVD